MSIKIRLIMMNFLQFFIWGAWLISIGGYLGGGLNFTAGQIGAIFSTLGIASLFAPAIMGIIADKWINVERVFGICHLLGAATLFWASTLKDPTWMFYAMLLNSIFYMPTIALSNTISYILLERKGYDLVKDFPPIRVWGTVGFIAAMWVVDVSGWKIDEAQLLLGCISAVVLGLYAFTLPACPPLKTNKKKSFAEAIGLNAFVLFKNKQVAIFFLFAMFLGAALQITNAFGGQFLNSFSSEYPQSFVVKHEIITLSISQVSESLFILTIPFFLIRFGIKKVMLFSMIAWFLRFGLFGIGNPGDGIFFLIASMVVYGMAFDFFNISGSLYVEKVAPMSIRASAQGLFMLMTNGMGAFLGGIISGWIVDNFTEYEELTNKVLSRDWQSIWFCFAGYALFLALVFPFVFKYNHQKGESLQPKH